MQINGHTSWLACRAECCGVLAFKDPGHLYKPVTSQWRLISKFEVTLAKLCIFPEFLEQDSMKPSYFPTIL